MQGAGNTEMEEHAVCPVPCPSEVTVVHALLEQEQQLS